jgi:hypothetical protein
VIGSIKPLCTSRQLYIANNRLAERAESADQALEAGFLVFRVKYAVHRICPYILYENSCRRAYNHESTRADVRTEQTPESAVLERWTLLERIESEHFWTC